MICRPRSSAQPQARLRLVFSEGVQNWHFAVIIACVYDGRPGAMFVPFSAQCIALSSLTYTHTQPVITTRTSSSLPWLPLCTTILCRLRGRAQLSFTGSRLM